MRVLVVTNFEPDESAPQRGRWVRDQIDEVVQHLDGMQVRKAG